MPLVAKEYKAGDIHPKSFWGNYFNEETKADVKKDAERVVRDYGSRNADWFERYCSQGGNRLTGDAIIITWVDEPEENEFGLVTP